MKKLLLVILIAINVSAEPSTIDDTCIPDSKGNDWCWRVYLKGAPKKCHITHMLYCDTKGCKIMCIDGTTCQKDGYPIEWGTTVECK